MIRLLGYRSRIWGNVLAGVALVGVALYLDAGPAALAVFGSMLVARAATNYRAWGKA